MKRAPPEERERLRREMEERDDNGRNHRSLKAVHLMSAEEVQSLFGDVTHGLAFLVGVDQGSNVDRLMFVVCYSMTSLSFIWT